MNKKQGEGVERDPRTGMASLYLWVDVQEGPLWGGGWWTDDKEALL